MEMGGKFGKILELGGNTIKGQGVVFWLMNDQVFIFLSEGVSWLFLVGSDWKTLTRCFYVILS